MLKITVLMPIIWYMVASSNLIEINSIPTGNVCFTPQVCFSSYCVFDYFTSIFQKKETEQREQLTKERAQSIDQQRYI